MNKYQEAKEILEKYDYSTKLELSEGIRNNITSGITVEQFFMMKKTCIELLDKATPKETVFDLENYMFYGLCPSCKSQKVADYEYDIVYNNCSYCGQKLSWDNHEGVNNKAIDWSNEDER